MKSCLAVRAALSYAAGLLADEEVREIALSACSKHGLRCVGPGR